MSKLKIKGRVVYPTTIFGVEKPVDGASVKLIDLDLDGSNDEIFKAETNDEGKFSGTTGEWQDRVKTRVWEAPSMSYPLGRWVSRKVPDVTDVLMLTAEVSGDGETMTTPFVYLGEGIEHKIVVSWSEQSVGMVNGESCKTYNEIFGKVREAVDDGVPNIQIKVDANVGEMFSELNRSPKQLRKWVFERIGLPNPDSVINKAFTGAEIAGIILAVAVLVVAIGGATATVILALSVLYAVHRGYDSISAETTTDTNGVTTTTIDIGKRSD